MLPSIEFGGVESVGRTFLANVDRSIFDICPILLVRPWQRTNILIDRLKRETYHILHVVPVAKKPPHQGKDHFRLLRAFCVAYRIVRNESIQLLHTHGYFADIIGGAVARLLGIPQVSTCHGFTAPNSKLRIYNFVNVLLLRQCKKVIAVSEAIRANLVKAGIRPSRIKVIENAIEDIQDSATVSQYRKKIRNLLGIAKQENVVGYVGRISPEKGLEHLIEAVCIMNRTGPLCKLLLIGEGPQEPQLRHMIREKGLNDDVLFAGFQEHVEEWLSVLDVFVLPSLTEGTPMVLLEAMANGIPVVATAVGGIPKIVRSNFNGLLVSPANPEELANGIRTVLSDEPMRTKMAAAAKDTIVARYNLDTWIKKIESVYLSVLSG